jgi:hypothetical protein
MSSLNSSRCSRLLGAAVSLALFTLASSPLRSAPVLRAAGTLELRNADWEAVRVEIRIGPSATCEANPDYQTRTLLRGKVWSITTSEGVCWRREAQPGGATEQWTDWQRPTLLEGGAVVRSL